MSTPGAIPSTRDTAPRAAAWRRLAAVLGAGLVTFTISESVFWGSWTSAYPGPDVALTATAYLVVVVAALFALERLGPPGPDGLILAGALVGWLVEGVVVLTVLESLPLTVVWTGLAWHALISVLGGWWGLPRLLAAAPRRRAAGLLGLGIGWGLWSAFLQRDEGVNESPLRFAGYALLTAALLAAGTWAWQQRPAGRLVPAAAGWTAVAALGAVLLAQVVAMPLAAVVIPLLAVTLAAMRALRRAVTGPVAPGPVAPGPVAPGPVAPGPVAPGPVPVRALGQVVLLPLAAVAGYATAGAVAAPVTGPLAYIVLSLAGFALWLRAVRRALMTLFRRHDPAGPRA